MNGRVARVTVLPDATGSEAVKVQRIATAEDLARLKPDWDRVQDTCPWKHVLLDHRWVSAWWRHFGDNKELHVLVLRRDGHISGIAPMILSGGMEAFPARDSGYQIVDDYAHLRVPRYLRVVPVRRVTFLLNIPSHNPCGHFLFESERADLYQAVAAYWAERAATWDIMSLDGIPLESPQPNSLARAAREASLTTLPHGIVRRIYTADLGGSMHAYLASRSRHFRKRLKEQLRECEKQGVIAVREYRTSDISAGLDIMFDIERRTWKARHDPSRKVRLSLDDRIRAFLADAVHAFAATDEAQVLVMTLDGRPVGALLGLSRQGISLSLLVYLDDDYRGHLNTNPLWKAFCETSIAHGMKRADFHGFTLFVRKWANSYVDRRRVYVVNDRLYSRCLGAVKAGTTWLSRTLRTRTGIGA